MSPPRAAALASTLRVGAGLLALALVVGCGASAPPPTRSAPEAPVRLGPLLDHVPGEPAWMALGSPSILLEEPSLRTVVDSIAPADALYAHVRQIRPAARRVFQFFLPYKLPVKNGGGTVKTTILR